MAQKKETLPVRVDVDLQNGGTITYAAEVIATIAGVAANEVEGIAGMCVSGGIGEILSRNRNITKGVKVEVGSQEAAVDLYAIVEYGYPIQKVAGEVQENVRKALESLTGLHVVRVDVHVQGVSFEKEKKAAQSNLEAGRSVTALTEPPAEPKREEKPVEPQPSKPVEQPAEMPEDKPKEESPAAQPVAAEPEPDTEAQAEEAINEAEDFDPETLAEEAALDAVTDDPEAVSAEQSAPRNGVPGRKRC